MLFESCIIKQFLSILIPPTKSNQHEHTVPSGYHIMTSFFCNAQKKVGISKSFSTTLTVSTYPESYRHLAKARNVKKKFELQNWEFGIFDKLEIETPQ